MIGRWISIAVILSLPHLSWAQDKKPTANMRTFDYACAKQKKNAPLCRCLSANLKLKFENEELSTDHMDLAVRAIKNDPPDTENTTQYDNLADILTGLEHHCKTNSKYSANR